MAARERTLRASHDTRPRRRGRSRRPSSGARRRARAPRSHVEGPKTRHDTVARSAHLAHDRRASASARDRDRRPAPESSARTRVTPIRPPARLRRVAAPPRDRHRGRRARAARADASSTSSTRSSGPCPVIVSTASRISSAFPTALPSGWSMSVSRHTTSLLGAPAEIDHLLGKDARVVERLHERAVADLDVEHDRVGAARELLRHDRRGDERDDVDGRGHVPERVELLVRRYEVAGLPDDREADLPHLRDELVDRQLDAVARDRLELVERSARVPEPAAAHLPERDAAGGDDRADRERRLVPDPAGRVLVDDAPAERARRDRASRRSGSSRRSAHASLARSGRGSRRPCTRRPSGSPEPRLARSRGRARRSRLPRAPRRSACARSGPWARVTAR